MNGRTALDRVNVVDDDDEVVDHRRGDLVAELLCPRLDRPAQGRSRGDSGKAATDPDPEMCEEGSTIGDPLVTREPYPRPPFDREDLGEEDALAVSRTGDDAEEPAAQADLGARNEVFARKTLLWKSRRGKAGLQDVSHARAAQPEASEQLAKGAGRTLTVLIPTGVNG